MAAAKWPLLAGNQDGSRPEPERRGQRVLGFAAPGLAPEKFGGDIVFRGEPVRSFTPVGLAVFGAPPGAKVRAVLFGPMHELLASYDPVPARLFSGFESFNALKKRVEEDQETLVGWGSFSTIHPGCYVVVLVSGVKLEDADSLEVAMWGWSVEL